MKPGPRNLLLSVGGILCVAFAFSQTAHWLLPAIGVAVGLVFSVGGGLWERSRSRRTFPSP
jgi:hypothetical protein